MGPFFVVFPDPVFRDFPNLGQSPEGCAVTAHNCTDMSLSIENFGDWLMPANSRFVNTESQTAHSEAAPKKISETLPSVNEKIMPPKTEPTRYRSSWLALKSRDSSASV